MPSLWAMPIRVVVAEDNVLLRDGLVRLISSVDDFELVGVVRHVRRAARRRSTTTDARRRGHRHPHAADRHRRGHPRSATALRSTHPDDRRRRAQPVRLAGVRAWRCSRTARDRRAYLLKDRVADVDDLVAAIRQVAAGGSVIDPKVVEELVGGSIRAAPVAARTPDRPRARDPRRDGAGQVERGHRRTLILSERAVEKHINSIFSKLHLTEERDVNRRVKAVLMYLTDR